MTGLMSFPWRLFLDVLVLERDSGCRAGSGCGGAWTPAFAGVTRENAGVTRENAGVTGEGAGVPRENAGVPQGAGETNRGFDMKRMQRDRQAGVTLLEMLIVVAVISILAAVVYPSYTDYVVRSNRAVGKSALLEVAARQEQYFANNASYASTTAQMGYPAAHHVDRDGEQGTAATSIYLISVANVTSAPIRDYNLTATRQNFQTRDTECGNLTLNERGVKGQTGSGERCWE